MEVSGVVTLHNASPFVQTSPWVLDTYSHFEALWEDTRPLFLVNSSLHACRAETREILVALWLCANDL